MKDSNNHDSAIWAVYDRMTHSFGPLAFRSHMQLMVDMCDLVL